MNPDWGLTSMTKIEVIVNGEDASAVTDMFRSAGAVGFTAISNVSGFGHGGYHQGRLSFNDKNALALLLVVLPDAQVADLLRGIRQLLQTRPGVFFVTPTCVSRPEYFT